MIIKPRWSQPKDDCIHAIQLVLTLVVEAVGFVFFRLVGNASSTTTKTGSGQSEHPQSWDFARGGRQLDMADFFLKETEAKACGKRYILARSGEPCDVLCVWLCATLKEFNFPGNFLFVRLQITIVSRIILVITLSQIQRMWSPSRSWHHYL